MSDVVPVSWTCVPARMAAPAFEYDGHEYFVRSVAHNVWDVHKCPPCGQAVATYRIRRERSGLTCDCPSGRRHLQCRHKRMVSMSLGIGDVGHGGTTRPPVPADPKGRAGAPAHARPSAEDLLERAQRTLEDFKRLKEKIMREGSSAG